MFVAMNATNFEHLEKDCPRCGGNGHIPKYRRIQHGVCFRCHGSGFASKAQWLPIESLEKVVLYEGCEYYQAKALLENGKTKWIPIVGEAAAVKGLTCSTALDALSLRYHPTHGLFFVRTVSRIYREANDFEEDRYERSGRHMTDEEICNAAFDGHWDIYAHHCGY